MMELACKAKGAVFKHDTQRRSKIGGEWLAGVHVKIIEWAQLASPFFLRADS